MITVSIFINGQPIYTRSAVRTGPVVVKGGNTYEVDDGSIIVHKHGDGAVKLAKKMLDTIKVKK